MGVSVPGPGLRGRGMDDSSAGEEASALEHASACEWAAWRDIDVHVHQHAHRYLATSLHDGKRCGNQCSLESASKCGNPAQQMVSLRGLASRRPADPGLPLAGGCPRATRLPRSSGSASLRGRDGRRLECPRDGRRRRTAGCTQQPRQGRLGPAACDGAPRLESRTRFMLP